MSATTVKTRTVRQRAVEATKALREQLGLDNIDLLSTAVAEVAVQEVASNPAFRERISTVYRDLLALHETRPLRTVIRPSTRPQLVPIGTIEGYEMDPAATLDPLFLLKLYGASQLRAALSEYSLAKLKEAATEIQTRNPGTKPTSKARKEAIIDYIVEKVAGPGY
jgi:hypothetical protein